MKLYRQRKKQEKQLVKQNDVSNKRTSSRKRISRAISRANRKIHKLEKELKTSNRKVWKLKKRISRLKIVKNESKSNKNQQKKENITPLTSADDEMRYVGLEPSKYKTIRRKLQFHNVLVEEIKVVDPCFTKNIVNGKVTKKYKMKSITSQVFGIRRRSLMSTSKKMKKVLRKRLPEIQEEIKTAVLTFLNRGDNSSIMPGKADYKTVSGQQKQKHILSDHMNNLFLKFRSENLDIKLSYSRFCKYRPINFSLVSYATRNTCLCIKHQNMALKLRCLHKIGIINCDSPDAFVKDVTDHFDVDALFPADSGPFQYDEWSRVNTDAGQRMNIVSKSCDRASFIKLFKPQLFEFKEHVNRVRNQYHALQDLKANLPRNHMIVQMDFAENFNCKTADEVQSSYFNKCYVSLHPVVVYYKVNDTLHHKSFTFISNDLSHNATFVFSVIKRLVPILETINLDLKCVHYWTDSPTSQYRNKHIFAIIKKHNDHFGVNCTWDYFEAGHGKGPCDGIGGTVKRCADLAIKQRKCTIQSADDFYTWASSSNISVAFKYISKEDISRYSIILNENIAKNCKPVKGTLKLHSVRRNGSSICIRNTSCYCMSCLSYEFCAGWTNV